jgi:hypothetical protein
MRGPGLCLICNRVWRPGGAAALGEPLRGLLVYGRIGSNRRRRKPDDMQLATRDTAVIAQASGPDDNPAAQLSGEVGRGRSPLSSTPAARFGLPRAFFEALTVLA